MRMTFICPEGLCQAANHLFMALGANAAEGRTFGAALWVAQDGHRFAAASLEASETWLATLTAPFTRPAWDQTAMVDLEAARDASERMFVVSDAPVHLSKDAITVITGLPGWQALSALGLQMIDPEEGN